MPRTSDAALLAAAAAGQVAAFVAAEIDFPGGVVRLCSLPWDITFGPGTFLGIGVLGRLNTIEEGAELQARGFSIGLSGIPRDVFNVVLTEEYQGRRAKVWMGFLDPTTHALIGTLLLASGRADNATIVFGETATIDIAIQDPAARWESAPIGRYTDADQQSRHPGDSFCAYVSSIAEGLTPVWPAGAFFR